MPSRMPYLDRGPCRHDWHVALPPLGLAPGAALFPGRSCMRLTLMHGLKSSALWSARTVRVSSAPRVPLALRWCCGVEREGDTPNFFLASPMGPGIVGIVRHSTQQRMTTETEPSLKSLRQQYPTLPVKGSSGAMREYVSGPKGNHPPTSHAFVVQQSPSSESRKTS